MNERLEYLRAQIRGERISLSELVELQGMADQIDPGDVELLEWAGVPEFPEGIDNPTYEEVMEAIMVEVQREVEMTFDNLGAPTLGDCMADVARRLNHLTGVEG